ncbi:hypothetical protein AB0L00_15195 [Actinoallomurus sp. NPDC052308]|uniref:hypothetical protein n=1 Tax=Actinoallomurus sp. NPDC052308 TaxID=3155530 RepID=UPI00341BB867
MIKSLGRCAAAVATAVLAAGGLGAAWQTTARAAAFSAAFTCNIGDLGQTAAVLNGWLTPPGNTYDGPARFWLHISNLNLQAPFPIDSWSGAAWVNVTGTENTTFQVAGSGGAVPEQGALAGDLAGDWAPAVAGTHLLSVGGLEITANSSQAGSVAVQCVPNGTPMAEVLQVAAPYRGQWVRPPAPLFHVGPWYRPGMILQRPVWVRPGGNRPDWNGPGWYHPPVYNRPVGPGGGWYHPGPIHHGGWSRHR